MFDLTETEVHAIDQRLEPVLAWADIRMTVDELWGHIEPKLAQGDDAWLGIH